MAEDGELESHGATRHPVSGRGQPPDWFILRARKAADSNGTVACASAVASAACAAASERCAELTWL